MLQNAPKVLNQEFNNCYPIYSNQEVKEKTRSQTKIPLKKQSQKEKKRE